MNYGVNNARSIPCKASRWHRMHPENEPCPECGPGMVVPLVQTLTRIARFDKSHTAALNVGNYVRTTDSEHTYLITGYTFRSGEFNLKRVDNVQGSVYPLRLVDLNVEEDDDTDDLYSMMSGMYP